MRWLLAVAIIALGAGIARAEAPYVHYADGRLSVRLTQVPLADVLARLAAETGATIRGDDPDARDVTAEFDDVPLERAIAQLLGSQNYTLRFGAQGTLASITLRGLPEAPSVPVPPSRPPTFLRTAHVTGKLEEALGASDVPLTKLFAAAAHQSDPAVRLEATRVLVHAIESDKAFRDIVVATDDATFAAMLRQHAGDGASQVAAGIMGAARSYELRAKAARVMQQLRQPPATTPGVAGLR